MTNSNLKNPHGTPNTTNIRPNSQKLIVGLTGGIGSGKTAASDWFAQQGIAIVDADVIAHEITAKDSPTLEQIKATFGDWVMTSTGELDRRALRAHVFSDPQALSDLEAITHPAIRHKIKASLQTAGSPYVILSAPLLLEGGPTGLVTLCERVLVIDVPEAVQWSRAASRDQQDIEKIKAIMSQQLSRHDRLQWADDVVINEGTLAELYQQLIPLHHQYLTIAAARC